jgi:hypothetical protein
MREWDEKAVAAHLADSVAPVPETRGQPGTGGFDRDRQQQYTQTDARHVRNMQLAILHLVGLLQDRVKPQFCSSIQYAFPVTRMT